MAKIGIYPGLLIILLVLVACEPVTLKEIESAQKTELTGEEDTIKEVVNELPEEAKQEIREASEEPPETILLIPDEIVIEKVQETVKQEPEVETKEVKTKTIVIENMELKPKEIFIFPDTEVVWANKDSLPHKITGPGFGSGTLNEGEEYKYRFTKFGKYRFTDEFHQSIWGYVHVLDLADLGIEVDNPDELVWILIENYKFNPETANIKKGQIVIWENRDPMAHTVEGTGFESPGLMMGKRFYHKFESIGTYFYKCSRHDKEKAKIVVS